MSLTWKPIVKSFWTKHGKLPKYKENEIQRNRPGSFHFRGEIVRVLIWEQLEVDHMMSWLSTLGGAFSALGDYFEEKSEIAGKISMQQLKLAIRLADPTLTSRCLLYFSISLIQKHKFKLAQRIIRSQFAFATMHEDVRLRKMCLGIWSKLQYTHKTTKQTVKANKDRK